MIANPIMETFKSDLFSKDQFAIMRNKEETIYTCPDYLSSKGLNKEWRERICEWSYEVVDHFDIQREVVSVSINCLDRFLATTYVNMKIFQLAAVTTLYIAIKIHEPQKLSLTSMIELSRDYFMAEHICAMEGRVLR